MLRKGGMTVLGGVKHVNSLFSLCVVLTLSVHEWMPLLFMTMFQAFIPSVWMDSIWTCKLCYWRAFFCFSWLFTLQFAFGKIPGDSHLQSFS